MKKLQKRILAAMLIMVMLVVAVAACADNETETYVPPVDVAPAQEVVTATDYVADTQPEEDGTEEITEIEEERTPLAHFENVLGISRFVSGLDEIAAMDEMVTITFGVYGAPAMTFEFIMDLVKEAIIAEMLLEPLPDFYDLLEEYSMQIKVSASLDEQMNMIFQIGLPSETGGFVYLLDMVIVENVIYIGIASYLDIVDDLFEFAMELMSEMGMLDGELHIMSLVVRDILSRFEGIDFIEIDLSEMGLFDFGEYMQQIQEFMDTIMDLGEVFAQSILEHPMLDTMLSDPDVLTMDGDWFVIDIDERQAQVLIEGIIDVLDDNAEAIVDLINQIMAMDSFDLDTAGLELTAQELRDVLAYYDPDFFNEFTGQFTLRGRADDEAVEMDTTIIITPVDEDITVWINMYAHTSARTGVITAPTERSVTVDELIEEVLGEYMDLFMPMIPLGI
ncbi:MAG: hypothetical protein FWC75_03750 [Oscillospiraceae bacterium]|nr:hypothetical protein [Oscillospiraceae bacterium]